MTYFSGHMHFKRAVKRHCEGCKVSKHVTKSPEVDVFASRVLVNAPINVKPAGGRRGIGRDFDRSFWPGVRAFELSCCPGSRDT